MARQIEMGRVNWMDPVAQVITVDPHAYPEGLYVNAVDLWFRGKPNTTGMTAGYGLPVIVQIRPMINGAPSGSEALTSTWRYASEVNVSTGSRSNAPGTANAATTTNFEFDHPVYLASGESYAIVVESNSIDYDLWTAKIGSTQAGTGGKSGIPTVTVDSQSHLGAFYKSQNGSLWAGEANQNMMFRLHKCVFDTDTAGSALFKTANTMSQYQPPHTRVHNALDHTEWSGLAFLGDVSQNPYTFKLWNKDFVFHRFRVDTSTLEYPSGTLSFEYAGTAEGVATVPNPSTLDQLNGYVGMELNEDTVANTSLQILKDESGSFILRGRLSTLSADVSPMIDLERISLTMIRNLINNGELFANTWPTNYVLTDDHAGGNNVGGGFYISSPGTGYASDDAITITTEDGNIGVGAVGAAIVNGTGSIVGVTLTNSGNTYLHTPTIVVGGGGTGATVLYVGEDEPKGPGNFEARYMTKKVPLTLHAEAKDIKVFLTAAQPLGTTIWVYTKVRNKADTDKFEDKRWTLMKRMQSFSEELSTDESDFNEISFMGAGENDEEFPLAYDANSDGLAYLVAAGPSAERYTTFNEFAIKIVMQSNDARIVPVIKDMRAVAVE